MDQISWNMDCISENLIVLVTTILTYILNRLWQNHETLELKLKKNERSFFYILLESKDSSLNQGVNWMLELTRFEVQNFLSNIIKQKTTFKKHKSKKKKDISEQPLSFFKDLKIADEYLVSKVLKDEGKKPVVFDEIKDRWSVDMNIMTKILISTEAKIQSFVTSNDAKFSRDWGN